MCDIHILVHSYMTNSFTIKPFNLSYAFQQSIDTRIYLCFYMRMELPKGRGSFPVGLHTTVKLIRIFTH